MLQLYNQKPISIFMIDNDHRVGVQFCNVKMKMELCQFCHFNDYLTRLSERIDDKTDNVELLLVKDNLNITISLNHFLQLSNAVKTVMVKKFGDKSRNLN
jgi:hypothetical protein